MIAGRSGAEAAIYIQDSAGDEGGGGAGKEGDRGGDLFRLAIASQSDEGFLPFGGRAVVRVHFRGDGTGLDELDGDVAGAEVAGSAFAAARDGSLGG